MKKLLSLLTIVSGLFMGLTQSAVAEEHPLSTIQGTEVDLKAYDHAFAGQIRDFVAFGVLDESTGTSELTMRRDGQVVRATFGPDEKTGKFGGVIRHVDAQEQAHETRIEFVRLDRKNNVFTFSINGQDVLVQVTFDAFANNHYLNPTYRTVIGGKSIEFTLKGSACYNFSAHLNFMILGALVH